MGIERVRGLQHGDVFQPLLFHQAANVHRVVFPDVRIAIEVTDSNLTVKLPFLDTDGEWLGDCDSTYPSASRIFASISWANFARRSR